MAAVEQTAISPVAARWLILGEWRAHPGRIVVAALAIAIGVALGFAVHLINASALNEFARAIRTVNGDADLQVQARTPLGFDEMLYPKLARVRGVAAASPVVELDAVAGPRARMLTVLGLDILRAAVATPSLAGHRVTGSPEDVFSPDSLFLSAAAMREMNAHAGDRIAITAAGRTAEFTIIGTLPGVPDDQSIGVIDIAAAQSRFGQLGRLQRVDLKLAEGADPQAVRAAIAAALPDDAELANQNTETRRTDSLSRAYRVNLDMLALMALLTGAFLVYSAQSLSVRRRHAEFALLRVLGLRRRALMAQIVAEGMIVGALGSALGLGLGLLLAKLALAYLGGDLGGGYFRGSRPDLIFAPAAAAAFFVLGIVASVAGSLLPARDAARAEPAIALKNAGDPADPKSRPNPWPAAILLAAGTGAAFFPATGGLPVFGYISMALLLAGGIAAMPLLARLLLSPMQRRRFASPAIELAVKRLWGAPGQAAIALCGIVASTSLMIAMAVMIWSFRGSVDEWLIQVLPADLYIRVNGDELDAFDAAAQARLAAAPGVAAIHFRRLAPLRLAADRPAIALLAEDIDRANPSRSLPIIGAFARVPEGAIPVYLSEPAVWVYPHRPGDWIDLPLASKSASGAGTRLFVAGIWRDYGRQQGTVAMDARDYTRLTGDRLRSDGAIDLKPGASLAGAIAGLRSALPASLSSRVDFVPSRQLRAEALAIFDRSFAVTYLLEAVAILVGLSGVAAIFSAQTLARAKEFGMLRHIGVGRQQIVAMLATEGALLGAVGVVAGIGLGIAMSQVLIHVVNPQSFHWTMETRLPYGLFAIVTVALIAAAAGTALLAGRRALSFDAVRAVREDW